MEAKIHPVMAYGVRCADAIACLRQHDHIEQTLLVLYAGIDTMAWLSVPEEESSGLDFQRWVEDYMLSRNGQLLPNVTAADLWGRDAAYSTQVRLSRGISVRAGRGNSSIRIMSKSSQRCRPTLPLSQSKTWDGRLRLRSYGLSMTWKRTPPRIRLQKRSLGEPSLPTRCELLNSTLENVMSS